MARICNPRPLRCAQRSIARFDSWHGLYTSETLALAVGNVNKVWHDGSVTYNGSGNNLDTVNLGYWEKLDFGDTYQSISRGVINAYNSNNGKIRALFNSYELTGGSMEVGGLLAAPFSEGTSLLVSQVGFRVSAIGNAGNITMDLLEGKIDMAAYRTIKFVATLGMGKAIEKLPYGSKLLDGIKTFTDTYVMPIFEDQFKKTN